MSIVANKKRSTLATVQRGFTLIELMVVIIVLGVLAVSAVSRFDNSGFAEYAYQSRLISSLRAVQQRAMQDTRDNYCFQINFDSAAQAFGPPTLSYRNNTTAEHSATCSTSIDGTTPEFLRASNGELQQDGIVMTMEDSGNGTFNYLGFDSFGRPLTDISSCQTLCSITFQGSQSPAVCIASEGYIYEC
jgi:MSHA pilin protein MshC